MRKAIKWVFVISLMVLAGLFAMASTTLDETGLTTTGSGSYANFSSTDGYVNGKHVADMSKAASITVCPEASCDYITDGTADDVQIQAAINEAKDYGEKGATVNVLCGDYYLASRIEIIQNTTNGMVNLVGGGVDCTRLITYNETALYIKQRGTAAGTETRYSGFTIEDRGNGLAATNATAIERFNGSRDVIQNVKILYAGTGIRNTCGILTTIRDVYIDGGTNSIYSDCPVVSNTQMVLDRVDAQDGIYIHNMAMVDAYSTDVGEGGLHLATVWNFNIVGGWGESAFTNLKLNDTNYGGTVINPNYGGNITLIDADNTIIMGKPTGLDFINIDTNSDGTRIIQAQQDTSHILDSGTNTIIDSSGTGIVKYDKVTANVTAYTQLKQFQTINGNITIDGRTWIEVDTEDYNATDNLDNINGGIPGQFLILGSAASTRDTTVKDGTGNIRLAGGDFTFTHVNDQLMLFYDEDYWREVSRADNT